MSDTCCPPTHFTKNVKNPPNNTSQGAANVDALYTHYQGILDNIGENSTREGLLDTPKRAARAMAFLTHGYTQTLDEVVGGAVFLSENREMVLVKDIEFYSLCEHHLLPFFGRVHIGYLPNGKVLGLSKLARISEMFARRLQIQENLTLQIAQAIIDATNCRGAMVMIDAAHMCMMMRGVQKQHSQTKTYAYLGDISEQDKARFLAQI